jgi:hypothetical protein
MDFVANNYFSRVYCIIAKRLATTARAMAGLSANRKAHASFTHRVMNGEVSKMRFSCERTCERRGKPLDAVGMLSTDVDERATA